MKNFLINQLIEQQSINFKKNKKIKILDNNSGKEEWEEECERMPELLYQFQIDESLSI